MIKVAIDTGPLTSGHKVRGIGVHTLELTEELKKIGDKSVQLDAVNFNDINLSKYDIAHYASFNPFFLSLPFSKPTGKVVLTIHDLIYLIYPNHYPPGIKGEIKFLIQKYLLKNIDAVITISETSKKDICRFLNIPPEKVNVVYLAPKSIFKPIKDVKNLNEVRQRLSLPDRFVLYVGDINYNKNIPTLIEACDIAKIPLVIAGKQAKDLAEGGIDDLRSLKGPMDFFRYLIGKPHPELAHYKKIWNKMKKSEVINLGFVPDTDLVVMYNLATVYCQPSFYEGFGLPAVEALACGTPLVCSKTQVLVEVVGDAALYADPKNPRDFAEKIKLLISDKNFANNLKRKGFERASQFTWKKTAQNTLEIYKKLF